MSTNKFEKSNKRKHFGKGGGFLKHKGKGVKRCHFYTSSQRRVDKKIDYEY